MIISGYIRRFGEQKLLEVCNGSNSITTGGVIADLAEYAETYRDEYGSLDWRIIRAASSRESPEWYKGTPFMLLTNSIEGQEFLEYVFGERLCVRAPLRLPPGTWIDDMPRYDGERDGSRWEISEPEIDVQQEVFSRISNSGANYIYTISVVDSNDEEFYYVGRTKHPIKRLRHHVSCGGDFVEAKRRGDTFVRKIHSIKPSSETTERNQYLEVQDNVHEEVYGGR